MPAAATPDAVSALTPLPRRWQVPALVALLTGLAWWLRSAFPPDAFADDPPYHLLRVLRLLHDAPAPTTPDAFVAHPVGSVTMWPWGFDWLLAALIRPCVGPSPTREAVVAACGAVIPFLGAALVPLVWRLARPVLPAGWALVACALVALQPLHVVYSAYGRVDHHVVEPLLFVLGALGPVSFLAHASRTGSRTLIGSGMMTGLTFAFFPTASLQVVLLVTFLGTALAVCPPRAGLAPARTFALSAVCGTALALLASPRPTALVFHTPSLLHVLLVASAGVAVVVAELGVRRGVRPALALAQGAALAAGALAALTAVLSGLWLAVTDGLAYVLQSRTGFMSDESQPLFGNLTTGLALVTWLAPLALVGVVAGVSPRPTSPARVALAALTLPLLFLACVQLRFVVVATPVLAVAVAQGLASLWQWTSSLRQTAGVHRLAHVLAFWALTGAALVPSTELIATGAPVPPVTRLMRAAAEVLERAPLAQGMGLLAPGPYGHLFKLYASVPTVCDNFWGDAESDAAQRRCLELLFAEGTVEAARLLSTLRIGAVVILAPTVTQVRADATRLGRPAELWVTAEGQLTAAFADTLWGRLARFGADAPAGAAGPYGLQLLERLSLTPAGRSRIRAYVYQLPEALPDAARAGH